MTEPRTKGGQGRRYSDAFKREAVSLLMSTQASAADVSAELGISVVAVAEGVGGAERAGGL
ncbi:MAG: hypothetical protein OXG05_02735 [Gammaproteobacteria bacterium]|nr:hypothetical protein [Gammaproteobacteria bacterium]